MLKTFYSNYKVQIYVVIAVLACLVVAVFAGNWYAKRQANEFAQSIHEQWKTENKVLYDNVIMNTYKVQELEKLYNEQNRAIAKLKKERETNVIQTIKEKDPKKLASLFDNSIDEYGVSDSFGR